MDLHVCPECGSGPHTAEEFGGHLADYHNFSGETDPSPYFQPRQNDAWQDIVDPVQNPSLVQGDGDYGMSYS